MWSSAGGRTAGTPDLSRSCCSSSILACMLMLPEITIQRSGTGMILLLFSDIFTPEQFTLQVGALVAVAVVQGAQTAPLAQHEICDLFGSHDVFLRHVDRQVMRLFAEVQRP